MTTTGVTATGVTNDLQGHRNLCKCGSHEHKLCSTPLVPSRHALGVEVIRLFNFRAFNFGDHTRLQKFLILNIYSGKICAHKILKLGYLL